MILNPIPSPPQFVIALTEHRIFGHILVPFFIEPNQQGTFYSIKASVLLQDVQQNPDLFSKAEKRLVELSEKYSDDSLARRFSKKLGSKDFFKKIDPDFFNGHITPFIDKQIVEALKIIQENQMRLYFKAAKYNNVYDEDLVKMGPEFAIPTFHFDLNEEGLNYHLTVKHKNHPIKLLHKKPLMITDTPCRMVMRNELIAFEKLQGKRLSPFFEKEVVKIPLSVVEKYMKSFVYGLIQDYQVEAKGFDIVHVESERKAILSIEKGIDLLPMMVLKFQYGAKRFQAGRVANVEVEFQKVDGKYIFKKHRRNLDWEKSVVEFLATQGMKLTGNVLAFSKDNLFNHDDRKYAVISWVNHCQAELKHFGISIEQHFEGINYYTGTQQLDINLKMEGDWFDLYAMVQFGEFQIPFIRLKKNILSGKREFILPNGDVAILPLEWFVKYKNLLPFGETVKDNLRFSKHHFNLIDEKIDGINPEIQDKINEFKTHQFELIDEPAGLNATLRHYQKEGYSWMQTLGKNNFGGCLADDMGLGKTLQTLTLLLSQKEEKAKELVNDLTSNTDDVQIFPVEKSASLASLIVLPTSLVHNWQNEIKKFAPHLKVYLHIGTQRKRIANLKGILEYYHIILTTYGTIRNDYELLKNLTFNYLILDESQNIKNSGSKTYQSVCKLQAKHKLVLTGTPIENSLTDLWSQLNFLNPGLLGTLPFFKKEYIQNIEKAKDEEKQKHLYHLISPFILRRTKDQVAKDLPPLTEQIRYCKMTDEQAKLYEEQKSVIRNSLMENIEKHGAEKSTFLALQGLTRLRQLANHPALFKQADVDSGKFNEVIRSMENLMAENHKVLIFSSFVTHLKLFQTEFENRNWEYCLLTGQTRDREQVIQDFQKNDKKRIFLISLKAGGVGLNLTSADYIFILDPWWNPAAENQAVNRAHRIGQDKKVFVYRFITEDSIEEKIQQLKERKLALANQFIQTNNPFHSISKDEMVDLFK
ncbi:MAG: DEAD/DEAH box helicase [Prolixibacteraceae bacterium]